MPRETTVRALYRRAIDRFGPTDQTLKAIEEMGELTQALCKHLVALTDGTSMEAQERMRRHIAEEMADVVIMLDQLSDIYQNRAEVLDWKAASRPGCGSDWTCWTGWTRRGRKRRRGGHDT